MVSLNHLWPHKVHPVLETDYIRHKLSNVAFYQNEYHPNLNGSHPHKGFAKGTGLVFGKILYRRKFFDL